MQGPRCQETGKFIFWSESNARYAVRQLVNAGRGGSQRDRLHPYRCGGHFHIGHADRMDLQKNRRAG